MFALADISLGLAAAIPGGEGRHRLSLDDAGEPALNLTPKRAHELLEYLEEKLGRATRSVRGTACTST